MLHPFTHTKPPKHPTIFLCSANNTYTHTESNLGFSILPRTLGHATGAVDRTTDLQSSGRPATPPKPQPPPPPKLSPILLFKKDFIKIRIIILLGWYAFPLLYK